MTEAHHVGGGVYRETVLNPPSSPRRRTSITGVAFGLALAVVSGAGVIRARPRRAIHATDATRDPFVTLLVNDAVSLVGGDRVCALTRGRGEQSEIVCLTPGPSASVNTWSAPTLIRITDTLGVTADGRGVEPVPGVTRARPVALPPTQEHGSIVELRRASRGGWVEGRYDSCGEPAFGISREPVHVARTYDGALLFASHEAGAWETLVYPRDDVRGFVVEDNRWYAITALGATLTGTFPMPRGFTLSPDAVTHALPSLRSAAEILLRGRYLCVRDHDGHVRCLDRGRALTTDLTDLPGGADAVALGDDDFCVRSVIGTWWCARGPSNEAPRGELDLRRLRRARLLDDAEEVAFAPGIGCARWTSGLVRCWGPQIKPVGPSGARGIESPSRQ